MFIKKIIAVMCATALMSSICTFTSSASDPGDVSGEVTKGTVIKTDTPESGGGGSGSVGILPSDEETLDPTEFYSLSISTDTTGAVVKISLKGTADKEGTVVLAGYDEKGRLLHFSTYAFSEKNAQEYSVSMGQYYYPTMKAFLWSGTELTPIPIAAAARADMDMASFATALYDDTYGGFAVDKVIGNTVDDTAQTVEIRAYTDAAKTNTTSYTLDLDKMKSIYINGTAASFSEKTNTKLAQYITQFAAQNPTGKVELTDFDKDGKYDRIDVFIYFDAVVESIDMTDAQKPVLHFGTCPTNGQYAKYDPSASAGDLAAEWQLDLQNKEYHFYDSPDAGKLVDFSSIKIGDVLSIRCDPKNIGNDPDITAFVSDQTVTGEVTAVEESQKTFPASTDKDITGSKYIINGKAYSPAGLGAVCPQKDGNAYTLHLDAFGKIAGSEINKAATLLPLTYESPVYTYSSSYEGGIYVYGGGNAEKVSLPTTSAAVAENLAEGDIIMCRSTAEGKVGEVTKLADVSLSAGYDKLYAAATSSKTSLGDIISNASAAAETMNAAQSEESKKTAFYFGPVIDKTSTGITLGKYDGGTAEYPIVTNKDNGAEYDYAYGCSFVEYSYGYPLQERIDVARSFDIAKTNIPKAAYIDGDQDTLINWKDPNFSTVGGINYAFVKTVYGVATDIVFIKPEYSGAESTTKDSFKTSSYVSTSGDFDVSSAPAEKSTAMIYAYKDHSAVQTVSYTIDFASVKSGANGGGVYVNGARIDAVTSAETMQKCLAEFVVCNPTGTVSLTDSDSNGTFERMDITAYLDVVVDSFDVSNPLNPSVTFATMANQTQYPDYLGLGVQYKLPTTLPSTLVLASKTYNFYDTPACLETIEPSSISAGDVLSAAFDPTKSFADAKSVTVIVSPGISFTGTASAVISADSYYPSVADLSKNGVRRAADDKYVVNGYAYRSSGNDVTAPAVGEKYLFRMDAFGRIASADKYNGS